MKNVEVIRFADADAVARAVAAAWVNVIATANQAGRAHHVALSGGRITLKFFAATIELSRAKNVSFDNTHFFWADERCVPPNDKESSFGAAQTAFFDPMKIRATRIHRVRGELAPDQAVAEANESIARVVPKDREGQPLLDIVFLGMGEDGHVASLFPRETEVERANPAVYRIITDSPKPPPTRVTLGYAALAAAHEVWVLASGTGKEEALRESLEVGGRTPLARVIQSRSTTKLFTDIQV